MKRITSTFLQGLIVILPLTVTVLVLVWLARTAERVLGAAVQWAVPDDWYVPGLGVLVGLVLTFLLGLLLKAWGVPQLIRFGEGLVGRVPLVKTIYGSVRDLLGFFSFSDDFGPGDRVVLVTMKDTGLQVVGLLTRDRFGDCTSESGADDHAVVYVPFSYMIGGGTTVIVPRDQVRALDMPLEEAMRFIVTGGVATDAGRR